MARSVTMKSRLARISDAAIELSPTPRVSNPRRRILRIAAWLIGSSSSSSFCRSIGVDVWGWLESLWESVTAISLGYVVLGCLFQGAQTLLTALGW